MSRFIQNYLHCDQWLKNNGFVGLKPEQSLKAANLHCSNINPIAHHENFEISHVDPLNADIEEVEDESIDDEYIKALYLNRKHQDELKRKRLEENYDNNRYNYIDVTQAESYIKYSIAPPQSTKNVKTNNKNFYRNLYGTISQVQIILNQETETQLNFDQFCDRHQPNFWPQLPIKLSFDSK